MRDATFERDGRRAWLMTEYGEDVRPHTALAVYLVNADGWHIGWNWWQVSVVHLRDEPGVAPARKHYPIAEYEIQILAIDPSHNLPDPDAPLPQDIRPLHPFDLIHQFHGVTDEQAAEIAALVVERAVNENVPLDQDLRTFWQEAIDSTVVHYREGVH